MKYKKTSALFALFLIGLIASTGALAHGFGKQWQENEDVSAALEAQDYNAFVAAISETERGSRLAERLTEEKFDSIVERYELRQAVHAALENEDYDAWVAAIGDHPRATELTEKITEENFGTFIQLHEARQEGDKETVKELAAELGIEKKHRGYRSHHKMGRGFGNFGR